MFNRLRENLQSWWSQRRMGSVREGVQLYEKGKIMDTSKPILFQGQEEVEVFKLEEEVRELDLKVKEIDKWLKPKEEKMRKKHRELWNY